MENSGDKMMENAKARSPQFQLDVPFGQGKRIPEQNVILQEDDKYIGYSDVTSGLLKRKYPDTSEDNSANKRRNEYNKLPENTANTSDIKIIAAGINTRNEARKCLDQTNAEESTSNEQTTTFLFRGPSGILEGKDVSDQVHKAEKEENHHAVLTTSSETTPPAIPKRPEASKFPKLYRLLRDDDDISRGLTAKDPNGNEGVARHVATGSKRGSSSQFLSTCSSRRGAESFRRFKLKHYRFKWGNKDIAEIDVESLPDDVKIIDLRTETLRRLHESGDSDIDDNFHKFAESHQEVLLVGKVPPSCLTLHKYTGTEPPDSGSDSDY